MNCDLIRGKEKMRDARSAYRSNFQCFREYEKRVYLKVNNFSGCEIYIVGCMEIEPMRVNDTDR